jgi:hypothetical protein
MNVSRIAAGIAIAIALASCVGRERSAATPVFAQAYGLGCTACHTQVPVLNAFGATCSMHRIIDAIERSSAEGVSVRIPRSRAPSNQRWTTCRETRARNGLQFTSNAMLG